MLQGRYRIYYIETGVFARDFFSFRMQTFVLKDITKPKALISVRIVIKYVLVVIIME